MSICRFQPSSLGRTPDFFVSSIRRVTGADVPTPYAQNLEALAFPTPELIVKVAKRACEQTINGTRKENVLTDHHLLIFQPRSVQVVDSKMQHPVMRSSVCASIYFSICENLLHPCSFGSICELCVIRLMKFTSGSFYQSDCDASQRDSLRPPIGALLL